MPNNVAVGGEYRVGGYARAREREPVRKPSLHFRYAVQTRARAQARSLKRKKGVGGARAVVGGT